ncbi:MAG: hypothetical protein COV08_01830 [Candidatus Vogelbacteria bacterium CG10_big_fil_rev_8_21_14_0_10_49_38]|uniref:Uncharacterized protein n=1 Tax=Candidatus Vogelbacteria bacterium CG10_big_fil_rev_8_21_14_0_10_49_38 TaxID=1975043 RepID=A0A2H0RHT8_9BACT|nr:MAG: hypothetical protein BK006_01845 [bacterium CG10_49_38]PIR45996.1 MAG: hypothetical protein COV08_01830 [Candidatus Vogelbacteria bacterium CG10_big_fil_rev_8_21_14_0_10_49_38]
MTIFSETHGDHYNIACPHCGKINHRVTEGVIVKCRMIKRFQKPCVHCGREIFYHARHEIRVTAFDLDLFAAKEGDSGAESCPRTED